MAQALELETDQIEESKFDPNKCFNCGETEFIEDASGRICEACGVIDERYRILVTENTTNYTARSKNCYSRGDYFKKCIERYQGLQNCKIPDQVYDALQDTEISRENILSCLKKLKLTRYNKHVHRIYFDLAGKKVDDIGYLEDKLFQDFILFIDAYYKLQFERKNFLNVQYVLYRLLIRNGHACDESNFSLPKTDKSKLSHDEICRRVFEKLNWVKENI